MCVCVCVCVCVCSTIEQGDQFSRNCEWRHTPSLSLSLSFSLCLIVKTTFRALELVRRKGHLRRWWVWQHQQWLLSQSAATVVHTCENVRCPSFDGDVQRTGATWRGRFGAQWFYCWQLFSKASGQTAASPVLCSVGTRVISVRLRQPGREGDHSPLSSAEVRNGWNYTFTPPIYLHVIQRDNFTFDHHNDTNSGVTFRNFPSSRRQTSPLTQWSLTSVFVRYANRGRVTSDICPIK